MTNAPVSTPLPDFLSRFDTTRRDRCHARCYGHHCLLWRCPFSITAIECSRGRKRKGPVAMTGPLCQWTELPVIPVDP